MSRKKHSYTSEYLTNLGAVNTTERNIKTADVIDFYCKECGTVGKAELNMAIKKDGWRCRPCGSRAQAKALAGRSIPESTVAKLKEKSKDTAATRKKNMIEKYGTDNVFQITGYNPMSSPESLKKIKKTNLERYGAEHQMKNKEIVDKVKKTNLERYGVTCTLRSEGSQKKIKETWTKKYGTDNPFDTVEVKEKIYATRAKNGTDRESHEEVEIFNYIKELGFNPRKSTINDGKGYVASIDILIPEKKIAIEYNGEYWHSELNGRGKQYHISKTNACINKGNSLIHIWGREWTEKKDIVKSYLRSRLGLNSTKVMARKCVIKEVGIEEASDFLNKNHLQGSCNSVGRFGLYYKNELVCLATVSKHHRGSETDTVVLSRFCSKFDTSVVGGLSKLSNFIKNKYINSRLITWVDLRLSSESGYVAAGWTVEDTLPPDYCYYDTRKCKVVSKQSRRKSAVGTPTDMTESEHAKLDGLTKVWDCGKKRLVFK